MMDWIREFDKSSENSYGSRRMKWALVESFFGSLKRERVNWENYQSRFEAQQDILDYIVMFYNSTCIMHVTGTPIYQILCWQSLAIKLTGCA